MTQNATGRITEHALAVLRLARAGQPLIPPDVEFVSRTVMVGKLREFGYLDADDKLTDMGRRSLEDQSR